MLLFLSIISYWVYPNDPTIILAYNEGKGITGSLKDFFKEVMDNNEDFYILRPNSTDVPVRISKIEDFKSECSAIYGTTYVYSNSTDLEYIYEQNSTGKVHEVTFSKDDLSTKCTEIQSIYKHAIMTDHYPEYKKVGYSNPFTPGVWNCFFFVIFCLFFIIWSMIHYANIDVQTRFAKKIN